LSIAPAPARAQNSGSLLSFSGTHPGEVSVAFLLDAPEAPAILTDTQQTQSDQPKSAGPNELPQNIPPAAVSEKSSSTRAAQISLEGSASVSGIVQDGSDAVISGAEIVLTKSGESGAQPVLTGADGTFAFHALLPGSYIITVQATGFQHFISSTFVLAEHDAYQLPTMTLLLAAVTTEVVVRPMAVMADQQLKAQEKQRVPRRQLCVCRA
jgi:hypothetical protein